MKRLSIATVALFSLLCSTAAAQELVVPAPAKGFPRVVAAGESGATLVVWATDDVYQGYGPLTVDTILSGPARQRRRSTIRNALLTDSARDRRNNLDVLVARGADPERGDRSSAADALSRPAGRARAADVVRRPWPARRRGQARLDRRGRLDRVPQARAVSSHGHEHPRAALHRPRTVKGVSGVPARGPVVRQRPRPHARRQRTPGGCTDGLAQAGADARDRRADSRRTRSYAADRQESKRARAGDDDRPRPRCGDGRRHRCGGRARRVRRRRRRPAPVGSGRDGARSGLHPYGSSTLTLSTVAAGERSLSPTSASGSGSCGRRRGPGRPTGA